MDICRLQDFAAEVGVSRQAIDQALARSQERPLPVAKIGDSNVYQRAELRAWWDKRAELMQHQARQRLAETGVQLNVRINPQALAALDAARRPRESRSTAGRRILHRALIGEDPAPLRTAAHR